MHELCVLYIVGVFLLAIGLAMALNCLGAFFITAGVGALVLGMFLYLHGKIF
jgi:hypothetical protein